MSRKRIIIAVAVAHFLLVLGLFGVLKATGFTLITLFGSPQPLSGFQSLVFDLFAFLLYPMCLLEMPPSVPENWFTVGLWVFAFNSIVWGVCLGVVIHAIRQGFRKTLTGPSRPGAVGLAGLLLPLCLLAAGCRASLERMALREIESRPLSKVYVNGLRFFGDAVKRGVVPDLQAGEAVDCEPFPVMSEEELGQVNYPVKMTIKLKKRENKTVLYSYTLLKESPTADWRIVEALRGQIVIQDKVDLLQKSTDTAR